MSSWKLYNKIDIGIGWQHDNEQNTLCNVMASFMIKVADTCELRSDLPPDTGVEHVMPLVVYCQPALEHMYCLAQADLLRSRLNSLVCCRKDWSDPFQAAPGAQSSITKERGQLCMTGDYGALNELAVENHLTLPRFGDVSDNLHGVQYS